MRGLIFTGVGEMEIRDFPDPTPDPARLSWTSNVQASAAPTCTTAQPQSEPRSDRGHECRHCFAVGDSITTVRSETALPCTTSSAAANAGTACPAMCSSVPQIVVHWPASSMAPCRKMSGQEASCLPLPDDISYAVSALSAASPGPPIPPCASSSQRAGVVAVFGLGPVVWRASPLQKLSAPV